MYRLLAIIPLLIVNTAFSELLTLPGEPVGEEMTLGSNPGNPTFKLPANAKLISAFGERPVFSPDGTKLAFIGESYGDAFEIELGSGRIRNLTNHAPHKGFLRVHYLSDGSLILLGPRVHASSREATRFGAIEMFWMDAAGQAPPVALNMTIFEGIATSRHGNKIAWSEVSPSVASFEAAESFVIKTGTIKMNEGTPTLAGVKQVLETRASECSVEPQDFLPDDSGLTFPCYRISGKDQDGELVVKTKVMALDFATGVTTEFPTPGQLYGEVEGLFPDGKKTLVECSGDRAAGMDICLLELKESNPGYTRLTRIMDFGRWKYGNPVVSPDGKRIAMQIGSADVIDPGVGQGIVLVDITKVIKQ